MASYHLPPYFRMASPNKDPAAFLRMLDARAAPPAPSPATDLAAASTAAGPAPTPPPRSAPRLSRILPHAERLESAAGACVRVRAHAPLNGSRSPEGYACPVADFEHPAAAEALAVLGRDPAWRSLPRERVAYVDIETTSLQGGSGTVAFLIGVGRFEGDAFCVRQYFMEDFGDEPAMLRTVAADLADADALVTYNGKRFDLPIMEVRWRLARLEPRFPRLHLDLLHPSRRLWSARLPDCRLGTVERHVLSILRYSDAPSSEIPQLYFDFVRGVRPERMSLVFDHHAQDIFTLAALGQALARAVAEPVDPRFLHASDQAGLARLYQSAGRREDALAALARAVEAANDGDAAYRLSMLLARALKRLDRHDEAVGIWNRWADQATLNRFDPLIELAKDSEHRLRDHAAAEHWTRRALDLLARHQDLADWLGRQPPPGLALLQDADLRRRLQRIQLKAERAGKKLLR